MPRGPRLDAPGALRHVIARGIERSTIFSDDADRTDFLDRLAALASAHSASGRGANNGMNGTHVPLPGDGQLHRVTALRASDRERLVDHWRRASEGRSRADSVKERGKGIP